MKNIGGIGCAPPTPTTPTMCTVSATTGGDGSITKPYVVTMSTLFDKTPPIKPAINLVSSISTTISGKAEDFSKVEIYKKGSLVNTKLGETQANETGAFKFNTKPLLPGTVIIAYAIDSAGNTSESTNITVSDKTPPSAPKVDSMKSTTKTITGVAEKNAIVKAYVGSKEIGKSKADNIFGAFKITIKPQKAGTVVMVYSTDAAGNKSVGTKVVVGK